MTQREFQAHIEQCEGVIGDMNDAFRAIMETIEDLPAPEDGATVEGLNAAITYIFETADEATR